MQVGFAKIKQFAGFSSCSARLFSISLYLLIIKYLALPAGKMI
jgi:hypothetical protein